MRKPVFASQEHKTIIEVYINMCKDFALEVGNKQRYQNYLDVYDTIIEYHNGYGKDKTSENFYDWLMIIPINMSVMTNGFFAGLETKNNRSVIRAYKLVLDEILQQTVDRIDNMQTYE